MFLRRFIREFPYKTDVRKAAAGALARLARRYLEYVGFTGQVQFTNLKTSNCGKTPFSKSE
jgi:hypothetical protein